MIPDSLRRRRLIAHILVAGAAIAAPVGVGASPEVVATRGLPSSITAEYGASVPLGAPLAPGTFAVATRWGIEIWNPSAGSVPVGSFRTAGVIRSLAVHGSTAYLFAGVRGIVAADVSDASAPEAIGSLGDLGDVSTGAVSGAGDALAVGSDRGLHFIGVSAPGAMDRRYTWTHPDGRVVRAIAARSDSFLVASERLTPTRRLFLTLYRFPSGAAAPESLRESSVALQAPSDLVWRGDFAFLAVGNAGVTVVRVPTGAARTTPAGGRFVGDLDVNDSLVVTTLSAAGLGKFRRSGFEGDSLTSFTSESIQLEPTRVSLVGDTVVLSTQSTLVADEPDEVARSQMELRDLDAPGLQSTMGGGTGRTRRVAVHAGYAYVADYTGGLRIYRAAGSDTSLVGALPVTGFTRVMDVALDPPRGRAYLAGMSGGLLVADVSDPSAPALLASMPFPEQVSSVAVVDSSLVVVGRRAPAAVGGLSFVDVTIPTGPVLRGEAAIALGDPRAIAIKDTIAFVADASRGLLSVGFGDPDNPAQIGPSSGIAARDLHRSGNTLLVGTRGEGLQIVDVSLVGSPQLRSTIFTPPIHGIARSGNSVALFLADEGALVVDITDPFAPVSRGPIEVPGSPRDGAWEGDTLLVTARTSLERFLVSPAATSVPSLQIELDPDVLVPRARISWTVGTPPSGPALVGWNLYRDTLPIPPSAANPAGVRINDPLLPPSATQLVDDSVPVGVRLRYRLEGFFEDGSARKMAEGFLQIAPAPAAGRAYPNPFTPGSGVVTIPFTISLTDPGPVEATVHDTMGRVVRRMDVTTTTGYGAVVWDGRNGSGRPVASGIYFIRIRGPGLDRSSRVVLVR
ncbi:MAG TPA: FlgD immunoglobulin-like domain containing protein [Candidatus Eisenbacteria bacterium]|nr:FlgD immunoglobulin-like domain containing protein [Candidatus Eisenbacteria bacterium]